MFTVRGILRLAIQKNISSVGNQNDVSPTSNVVSPFPLKKLFLCIWMRQKEIHLLCKNCVNRPVTFWIIPYFRSVVYPLPPVCQTQNVIYPYFWRYVILENLCPNFTINKWRYVIMENLERPELAKSQAIIITN